MDLYDDPEDPYITAVLELPGVHTEDLRLHIENHFLLIEGRRRGPGVALNDTAQPTGNGEDTGDAASADRSELALGSSTVQRNAKVRELRYGQFRRAIELPHGMEVSTCSVPADSSLSNLLNRRATSRHRWGSEC